jgi:hypothetical protein
MNAPRVDTLPLTITPMRFTLRALDPVRLPAFAGSTLRGALGNTLRALTCATGAPECDGCPRLAQCAFPRLWIGSHHQGVDPGFDRNALANAPPPYLVVPPPYTGHPTYLQPGDLFGFRLNLIGDSGRRAELWEAAVRAAALNGFAEGRGRLAASCSVDAPFRPTSDPGPWLAPVRLHFETPLHILRERHRLDHFDPIAFTRRLTDRVERLVTLYGDGPSPLDANELDDQAARVVVVEQHIRAVHDERISDRQGRNIPITGFVGSVTLDAVPRPLRSLWRLAEWLHAGKGAPMGLGRVVVKTASRGSHP